MGPDWQAKQENNRNNVTMYREAQSTSVESDYSLTHPTRHCCPHCFLQAASAQRPSLETGLPRTSLAKEQKVEGRSCRDLFKRYNSFEICICQAWWFIRLTGDHCE